MELHRTLVSRRIARADDDSAPSLFRLWFLAVMGLLAAVASGSDVDTGGVGSPAETPPTAPHPFVLNEVGLGPDGGARWIELANRHAESISAGGWSLTFESGEALEVPAAAPPCPPLGFVLLELGAAADDVSVDSHAVRVRRSWTPHAGGAGGRVTLRGPEGTAVDSVAWGAVAPDPTALGPPPLWPPYGVLPEAGLFAANDVLLRLAEARGAERSDSPQWLYRDAMSATPGEPNLFPGPVTMTPGDGTEMVTPVPLGVTGLRWADSVVFQVARDAGFSELVLEETSAGSELTVADLPPATYYWRVRAAGPGIGTWSPARTFAVLPDGLETLLESLGRDSDQSRERADPAAAGESGPGSGFRAAPVSLDKVPPAPKEGSGGYALPSGVEVLASRVLNLTHEVQRKDTHMACIDGCPLHGAESWIEPHAKTMGHGSQYCTRAVIAMIASLGGCRLSQDRITYHIFEEADPPTRGGEDSGELGSPYGDLGHHLGTRPVSDALPTLDWLYRQPLGSAGAMVPGPQVFDDRDDEDIDSIREFLDDGRPVIRNFPRHSTVIDGYAILRAFSGEEQVFIRVLDPAVTRPHSWIKFDDPGVSFYVTPPRQGQPARCDEPEVSRDSDGDGLVDFDEIHRFGTDPQVADSDEDLIPDMVDVYGYVFTPSGDWTIGMRDTDGDGLPKELDPDNDRTDNDGVIDGCEDLNRNGFFDPGNESDPFEPTDDFTVLGEDCFRGELRLESVISGPLPGATLQVHEELLIDRFHAIGRGNFEHHYAWSLFGEYSMSLPMLPGVSGGAIRSVSEGEGTSNGSIQVDIDQDGHYQLVTDVQQRVADYTITTTGDGQTRVKEADYELGFADHHYDYVSPDTPESVRAWLKSNTPGNVFEGDVVSLPDGSLLLSGSDTLTLPPEIGGPNLHGETRRTWKLRLEAPRRD